ncbi:hypothetical protein, partial [Flavobacterium sp. XS2P39]|uniref:hypothetical protein n=1 Tax=Flavobacterium sp. XS2P39 TaxID=3401725 RepID=UPI003AAF50BC
YSFLPIILHLFLLIIVHYSCQLSCTLNCQKSCTFIYRSQMDWNASLEYYFEDIKTGKKKEGSAMEADILKLKEVFIKENFKTI